MVTTVIFDMDGTLADNSYLHTLAWWYACREHDIPVTMASIHRLIGMGGDQMVPAMVGHEMPALEQAHARRYRSVLADVTVLPGATELIGELHRRGVTIALASSSSRADLDVLLARITTGSLIDHVVSKDDVAASKPAPDLVVVALKASGAEPDEPSSSVTRDGTSRRRRAPAFPASASARVAGRSRSCATRAPSRCTPTPLPFCPGSTTAWSAPTSGAPGPEQAARSCPGGGVLPGVRRDDPLSHVRGHLLVVSR